jgi:hypothetical protein
MGEIFAFSNERTLDRVIQIASVPLNFLVGSRLLQPEDIVYAKITELESDTEAKAVQVIRKSDETTEDFDEGLTWDSDADQSEKNIVENLIAYEGFKFKVDQLVECAYIPFADEPKWVGFPPSAGSERPWIRITSVTNPSTYVGDIETNPFDNTVIEPSVAVRVPNATANQIAVGDTFFADGPFDDGGTLTYIIDAPLLA